LRSDDLGQADAVRRFAFGTFLGLPHPMRFRGDADPVRPRYLTDPAGSFAAELNGDLVGTNVVVDWGSVGFFGPLSVHPEYWDRGIAQRLVEAALDELGRRGTRHVGLFTFAHSPKHLALYQKFGFWPRFLTAIMIKPVTRLESPVMWSPFSTLPMSRRQRSLDACRALADSLHPGLDLSREIQAVAEHGFGETVLLGDAAAPEGFAVCHLGPGTEAGGGRCYVKFGAVRPGTEAEVAFGQLLAACEALAVARGVDLLVAGVNTARREAYRHLLGSGFRIEVLGLAMDRPDEAAYNRSGVYVIDDWR
jgi:ribosomal protein S18 acetylase RimI-like enzyme